MSPFPPFYIKKRVGCVIQNEIFIHFALLSFLSSQIKNVWGLVNVVAHGAGQAILQLDVSYGIDWTDLKKQPPVDAFKMVINERYSKFRNKSICNVEICAR